MEMAVTRGVRARALVEPSVSEMLSDPIVQALMRADGVQACDLKALLCSVAKRIRDGSRSKVRKECRDEHTNVSSE